MRLPLFACDLAGVSRCRSGAAEPRRARRTFENCAFCCGMRTAATSWLKINNFETSFSIPRKLTLRCYWLLVRCCGGWRFSEPLQQADAPARITTAAYCRTTSKPFHQQTAAHWILPGGLLALPDDTAVMRTPVGFPSQLSTLPTAPVGLRAQLPAWLGNSAALTASMQATLLFHVFKFSTFSLKNSYTTGATYQSQNVLLMTSSLLGSSYHCQLTFMRHFYRCALPVSCPHGCVSPLGYSSFLPVSLPQFLVPIYLAAVQPLRRIRPPLFPNRLSPSHPLTFPQEGSGTQDLSNWQGHACCGRPAGQERRDSEEQHPGT